MKLKDLTNQRFGRLAVLSLSNNSHRRVYWHCKCDCGAYIDVASNSLRSGHTISCGCYRAEVSSKRIGRNNKGKKAYNRMPDGMAAERAVFNDYISHAKTRYLSFQLSLKDFKKLIYQPCFYCGCSHSMFKSTFTSTGTIYYNGVDRLDPFFGYSKDNTVPCCKLCNQIKWTMNNLEFAEHIAKVHNHLWNKGIINEPLLNSLSLERKSL